MDNFREIAEELDIYAREGTNSKIADLISQRGMLTDEAYINDSLGLWLNGSEQIGKKEVAKMIIMYLGLYVEAVQVNREETVKALSMFWLGTEDDRELEYMTSYSEYCRKKWN
uniref:hypothetical protein n=1 Tax=Listeria seeligeri TaxID=1640 RepID=UPI0018EA38EC|nr:hypothetical protein [Listeria seeligeri]